MLIYFLLVLDTLQLAYFIVFLFLKLLLLTLHELQKIIYLLHQVLLYVPVPKREVLIHPHLLRPVLVDFILALLLADARIRFFHYQYRILQGSFLT